VFRTRPSPEAVQLEGVEITDGAISRGPGDSRPPFFFFFFFFAAEIVEGNAQGALERRPGYRTPNPASVITARISLDPTRHSGSGVGARRPVSPRAAALLSLRIPGPVISADRTRTR